MEVEWGLQQFPPVVPLNVGGRHFTTSLETLQGGSGPADAGRSMLAAMFSGRLPTRRDADGRFFIDRDGRHFHHFLNYLRDGTLPVALSPAERLEVEREAAFFGLEALAAHLRADLPAASPKRPPAPTVSGAAEASPEAPEATAPAGTAVAESLEAPLPPTFRGFGDLWAGTSASDRSSLRMVSAAEAADLVLNQCLEEWSEFPQYIQGVLLRLLRAGGVPPEAVGGGDSPVSPGRLDRGVVLDEGSAAALQAGTLAATQIELAHVEMHSKAWRWSDRKTGVNSVLRAKLLRCHLERLGFVCRIVPVLDRQEVAAYVMQVELPMPA